MKKEKKMSEVKKVDILPFEVVKIVGRKKVDIAREFSLPQGAILGEDNGFAIVDRKTNRVHTVLPGETLNSIAQKYGTSAQEIKEKNNILFIFVGQQLLI